VAEDIPPREADGFAKRGEIAGVMLDARAASTWRDLRRSASSLIVEDELTRVSERRECGPKQVVVEQQAAIHADERHGTAYFRREVDGEFESACAYGALGQAR
jgi:hypothetical protein